MRRLLAIGLLTSMLAMWGAPAHAAKTFNVTQTSPTPTPGLFDMGTSQSVTLNVANTSTGGDINQRIFQIQFQLPTSCTSPCTLTTFSSATAAPAGWTRTALSSSSVTFKASGFSTAISVGQSASFTLALVTGTFTVNTTQALTKITARFSSQTNFGGAHSINCTSTGGCGSLGSWKAMSLQITGFQTTDTSGAPVSAIASGTSFLIVITVKNISSVTQNGIAANPSPPSAAKMGTWSANSPNCSLTGTNPSPLNLAAGASGTITYTCTTHIAPPNPTDSGTVTYSVTNVWNSAHTATSRSVSSNTLSVSPLTASIAITPACLFVGDTATFTMTVTNNTGGSVTNVLTTLNPPTVANGASIGAYTSGATTCTAGSSPSNLANLASCNFSWTATAGISGAYPNVPPQPSFFTTGFATACPNGSTCPPTSPIQTPTASSTPNPMFILEYPVTVTPTSITAADTNVELDFNMANLGCASASVTSVAITSIPAGWILSTDPSYAYSLVVDTTGPNESWTISGTTFTSNSPPSTNVPLNQTDNDFYLLFSTTPSTTGTNNFTVVVTDTNGVARTQTMSVNSNALVPGSVNPTWWKEIFQ